jgi:hypothetical protein
MNLVASQWWSLTSVQNTQYTQITIISSIYKTFCYCYKKTKQNTLRFGSKLLPSSRTWRRKQCASKRVCFFKYFMTMENFLVNDPDITHVQPLSKAYILYIKIILCDENQPDALFFLNLFRQTTSTCFGDVYCPSSGSIHCVCTVNTSWWWAINMPETCRSLLTK